MPNDPRIKFKKKMYDTSHNIIGFAGSGGGRGSRSIYEDGTPPPDPGGGGTGGGTDAGIDGGGGYTPAGAILQPLKPSLNAGEITGITIGALAGLGTLEVARRAYLEYLEEEKRKRGMQPVSQSDRPIKARRGGNILQRSRVGLTRGIERGINTAVQSFEMMTTPTPFVPLTESSTPDSFRSARSGASTPDLQSSRSRPDNYEGRVTEKGINRWAQAPTEVGDRPASVVIRDPKHSSLFTALDNDPNRLSTIFTSDMGTLGKIEASPITKPTPPIRKPDVNLNLQQELEKRQIQIEDPNISEGRIKTLQSEIRVLERQIESSGGTVTSLEERTRLASTTPVYTESLIRLTPEEQAKLERTVFFDLNDIHGIHEMTNEQFRAFAKEKGVNIGGPSAATGTPEMTKIDFLETFIDNIELKLMDPQMPSARRQELVAQQKKLRNAVTRQQAIESLKIKSMHAKNTARALKTALQEQIRTARIPKTVAPQTPTANNPIDDRITAAQPTRETEMTSLGAHEQRLQTALDAMVEVKTKGPTLIERGTTAMQRAITRKPAEPRVKVEPIGTTPSNRAALERARAASALTSDTEMRPLTQQPIETASRAALGTDTELTLEERRIIGPELSERAAAGVGFDLGEPGGDARRERIRQFIEEPPPAPAPVERPAPAPVEPAPVEPAPAPEPVERPAPAPVERTAPVELTPIQEINEHIQHLQELHDSTSRYYAEEGRTLPEPTSDSYKANFSEGEFEWASKTYTMRKVLKDPANANRTVINQETGAEITMEEAFNDLMARHKRIKELKEGLNINLDAELKAHAKTIAKTETKSKATFGKRKGPKPNQKRSLTKKGTASAAIEQRPTQTALTAEASRARASAPAEARATAPEARAAQAEMRTAPEAMSARSVLAPEVSARVPILTAPEPSGPQVRAQVQSINKTGKPVAPPIEPAGPSPPPSAPGSGTATPQEGATVERTPAERASLAEEVSAGLNKKPSRQKVKQNIGKPKTTANPLERFVAPQFRNAANVEIHPGSKSLSGTLSELGSRVPRLVPTRQVLISAGHAVAAEGGGAVAGFFAGSYAGQKMNEYFANHPPKNRGEEFGQALATNFVALAAGNLVSKVVTYVIKQGARVVVGAAISGSLSSAGAGGSTAILEAALFAGVATTTQYFTTKALEDAGYNHETSRSQGSLAATLALMDLEMASWLLKGGPVNLYADAAFVVSELFIIGFGIWSYFEEKKEGAAEDAEEEATRAQREQEVKDRNESIARINATNNSRASFMIQLETHNYDFDEIYATLNEQQKIELGISTPEGKAAFQRQVESAFFPFGMEETPTGFQAPVVLSPIELQRRDVFNRYISWYQKDLRGEPQPPFNFNDPKVVELNEYSGGTWESAARVSATTAHMQAERVHPLIEDAQNQIINAFHNERKTIERMPPDVVRYALLDPSFRKNYEDYIVADAQAQILIEFNRTQYTYRDVDPELLAIADRDPNFRAAADAYYQVLANQARDLNLSISAVAHLNSLMETDQVIEIGKLNDARNLIVSRNMADNQAAIDTYNANIVQAINMYGDNFEAIIRNINEQSLLSGHTFLYASTRADLYRQLHMEMPEIEIVDPGDEIDQGDATWHTGKGRKVGDTAIYNYRYYLTDQQNQELEDMIARGEITRDQEEDQAIIIRERDRFLYEETDQERADNLKMTLPEYYAKYGIPVDPYTMPIVDYTQITKIPTNGRVRQPDGTIFTYRNGLLVNKEKGTIEIIDTKKDDIPYNPALATQPDGVIAMPDGSRRTYKDGKVVFVEYPPGTARVDMLTPDQINAGMGTSTTPSYEELKTMYPDAYKTLLNKYAGDPDADAKIAETLARGHKNGLYYPGGASREDGDPIPVDPTDPTDPTPVTPITPVTPVTPVTPITPVIRNREPTYEELKKMYPEQFNIYHTANSGLGQEDKTEMMLRKLDRRRIEAGTAPALPAEVIPGVTPVETITAPEPKINVLFTGDRKMPNKSIRTYKDGKIVAINYPPNTPPSRMDDDDLTPEGIASLNQREGLYYDPNPSAPVTPVTPTEQLKNGEVKMADGSLRTYSNGLVVNVQYPVGTKNPKTPAQINQEEGTRDASYTAPVVPVVPVVPSTQLQQGLVKMPDGSKRFYIDGKVVSVEYPPGVTGPTLHEINAAEGTKAPTLDPVREQKILFIMSYFGHTRENAERIVEIGEINRLSPPDGHESLDPFREPTFEDLQIMYGRNLVGTPNAEQNYRILHADEKANGTAPPLPTGKQINEHRNRVDPPPTTVIPGVYQPPAPLPPVTYDREPTYEELVQMYGITFAGTNNPEQNLRILHADEVANGTAPPLPPLRQTPTTTTPTSITITTPAPAGTGSFNSEPGTYTAPVATGTGANTQRAGTTPAPTTNP